MKKTAIFLAALLLVQMICICIPASAGNTMYFGSWISENWDDGGVYVSNLAVSGSGDGGLTFTNSLENIDRCIYAFTNDIIDQLPYFIYSIADAADLTKIEVTKRFSTEITPEMTELDISAGAHCVDLRTMLDGKDTIGYTYVLIYANAGSSITFQKMCFSDTDLEGNLYTPPTMPPVPDGDAAHMIKYQLKAYAEDTVPENGGTSWLMSVDDTGARTIKCTPDAENKSFTLQREDGRTEQFINIAWVIPYEQLKQTPYFAIDIANKGRQDEGPKIGMFAYWEGIGGDTVAYFDGIGRKEIFANTISGLNKFPLLYAVEQTPEDKRGDQGIALIVRMCIERSDGTTLEPLQINEAYLFNYDGQGTTPTDPTGKPAQSEDGDFPWVPVAIVAAVVVVAAVVITVVVSKKKK